MTDTALYDAERLALIDRGRSVCREARLVERALQRLDPQLHLVFVGEVPDDRLLPGLISNHWHVLVKARKNVPDTMDYYWPLAGPNGEIVHPTMKLVDDMKAADLWRPGALRELRERHERQARAAEKAAELASEQRRDIIAVDWRAAKRVAGDGGIHRRVWGRGKPPKGLVGA